MARYTNGEILNNKRVVEIMDNLVEKYYQKLKSIIPDKDENEPLNANELSIIEKASQADAGGTVYDSETAPFYICRYGKAYIYEYALIYDMLLRILNNDRCYNVKMLSLGCGSMIDAFSMVFAASKLAFSSDFYMRMPRITYTGVDNAPWDEFCLMVTPDKINGTANPNPDPDTVPIALRFDKVEFFRESMFDYLRRKYPVGSNFDSNVIVFPKVLNTIADYTDELLDCFRNRNFPLDEYFIVVSHAESSTSETMKVVDELIDIINETGDFEVCSNLQEMLGDDKWNRVHNLYLKGKTDSANSLIKGNEKRGVTYAPDDEMQNLCYIFENEEQAFSQLNRDFFLGDRNNSDNPDTPFKYLDRLSTRSNNTYHIMPIATVQYFTLEIVRLKRR